MRRLALLLLLAYVLGVLLFPAAINPESSAWLRTAFLADFCAAGVTFVVLLRRLLANDLPTSKDVAR
ncbi:hypothetical protein [Deinococcus apachensis]|uniref:hypothetical protein n=1 Tax=Deinococcus apachensis TaxID=309886 RepID=UPI00035D315E|nr:hypothetical protein [Deinococcus apachensis]